MAHEGNGDVVGVLLALEVFAVHGEREVAPFRRHALVDRLEEHVLVAGGVEVVEADADKVG